MKITVQNVGPIKNASVEIGNLTVICGKNNTGKTYLTYAVSELLMILSMGLFNKSTKNIDFDNITKELISKGKYTLPLNIIEKELRNVVDNHTELGLKRLANLFAMNEQEFKNSKVFLEKTETDFLQKGIENKKFTYTYNDEYIVTCVFIKNAFHFEFENLSGNIKTEDFRLDYLLRMAFSRAFLPFPTLLTVHREALILLGRLVSLNKETLFNHLMSSNDLKVMDEIRDVIALPKPIIDNIQFYHQRDLFIKNSFLVEKYPDIVEEIENILGLKFINTEKGNQIQDANTGRVLLPYMVSTSARSLYGLHLWIKHQAKEGDIIMIDEPELGLHPENQIKLARLFVKLVNAGVKVWIATQSDYIVKEINNMILLSNDISEKVEIMKNHGYSQFDMLKSSDVKVYITEKGTVNEIKVTDRGMESSEFDDAIYRLNEVTDEIMFDLSL